MGREVKGADFRQDWTGVGVTSWTWGTTTTTSRASIRTACRVCGDALRGSPTRSSTTRGLASRAVCSNILITRRFSISRLIMEGEGITLEMMLAASFCSLLAAFSSSTPFYTAATLRLKTTEVGRILGP